MIQRNILLFLFACLALSVSAQKAERDAIREGNKSYNQQLYGKAEEQYKKALEVNAASKEASYNLANTYYKQQNWDEALDEYQHYLTLENEDPIKISAVWANIGNTYLKKKDAESAQKMPEQGQQKAPDNLELSMESYKNSLRLNSIDNDVRYNLAVVQKMIQDQEGEGGGEDDQQDQEDKKDEKKDEQQEQKPEDKKDDKKEQQEEQQMSQENIEQMLKAIEQDERETQERVKQMQAEERKRQNQHNKQHNKDW